MSKEEALNRIIDSYDAYYVENKYGKGTHEEEFELLSQLKGDKVSNAIAWIRDCYDCYYKEDYINDDSSAFAYLRSLIDKENQNEIN